MCHLGHDTESIRLVWLECAASIFLKAIVLQESINLLAPTYNALAQFAFIFSFSMLFITIFTASLFE